MNNKVTKPFFTHDFSPLEDKKLLKLDISMGNEGYGIYWKIVEFMHQNDFFVGEEDILAYKFHTDSEKIMRIMNNFELFKIQDNRYISDRILRNLNYIDQKKEDKKQAANIRWLLSSFNKAYAEYFNSEPVLSSEEIDTLKKYNKTIPNLKNMLPDILWTLKNLKFTTDITFKPCANWLLKSNNLSRLINGEFGPLLHKTTEEELKEQQRKKSIAEAEQNKPSEIDLKIQKCQNKKEAIELITDYYTDKKLISKQDKVLIAPIFRPLMKKFDITDKEVYDKCQH